MWLQNALKLKQKFKAKTIITGHQAFDKTKSLSQTIKLLKKEDKAIRKRIEKANADF